MLKKCLKRVSAKMAADLELRDELREGFYIVALVNEFGVVIKKKGIFIGLNDKTLREALDYKETLDYPPYYGYNWRWSFNDP